MLQNTSTRIRLARNVGAYDRIARLLFAATLLAPAFVGNDAGPLGWLVASVLMALYPAITGLIGWDPIYRLLDLSTGHGKVVPRDAAQEVESLMRRYHGDRIAADVGKARIPVETNIQAPRDKRAA